MEINKTDVKAAEKLGIGNVDPVETDRVEANGAEVDGIEANEADKSDTGLANPANPAKTNGVNKQSTSITNPMEVDGAKESDIGLATEDP